MSNKTFKKMRKAVRTEYRKELAGMCRYPFGRRVGIAWRIFWGIVDSPRAGDIDTTGRAQ
jgi:hypothetical protein